MIKRTTRGETRLAFEKAVRDRQPERCRLSILCVDIQRSGVPSLMRRQSDSNNLLKGLICSIVLGAAILPGCSSDVPIGKPASPEEQKQTFEKQNEDLAKSVTSNPKAKGAIPKSIKGGMFKGGMPSQ